MQVNNWWSSCFKFRVPPTNLPCQHQHVGFCNFRKSQFSFTTFTFSQKFCLHLIRKSKGMSICDNNLSIMVNCVMHVQVLLFSANGRLSSKSLQQTTCHYSRDSQRGQLVKLQSKTQPAWFLFCFEGVFCLNPKGGNIVTFLLIH